MKCLFFNRQIKAAGGVLQALGVINLVCFRDAHLTPIFLHQSSWKAHLGNGRAKKKQKLLLPYNSYLIYLIYLLMIVLMRSRSHIVLVVV